MLNKKGKCMNNSHGAVHYLTLPSEQEGIIICTGNDEHCFRLIRRF